MHTDGKKRGNLLLSLFFILIFSQVQLRSQDLSHFASVALNFYRLSSLSIDDVNRPGRKVNSRFFYHDYYRKEINGIKTLTWDGYSLRMDSYLNRPGKNLNLGMHVAVTGNRSLFNNRQNITSVTFRGRRSYTKGMIELAASDGTGLLGVGVGFDQTEFTVPFTVHEYPRSEDGNMQMFFLDWLGPTFGNKLDFEGDASGKQLKIFATLPVSNQKQMNLIFRHISRSPESTLSYVNQSNIPQLTGERSMTIPLEWKDNVFQAELLNQTLHLSTALSLFTTGITYSVDNDLPITDALNLDLVPVLGRGEIDRSGAAVEVEKTQGQFRFAAGIGYSKVTGSVDMATPVLGRYLLLPISHGVEGKIFGSNFAQKLGINYQIFFLAFNTHLFIGYLHSYFDFQIDGEAQLEFNLISRPINYPLQYQVHILDLQANLAKQWGPVVIQYSFNQMIPYLKRVDDSPIRFNREDIKVERSDRGGGLHAVAVWYRW